MTHVQELEDVIAGVSPETLTAFFQAASDRFRPNRRDCLAELKDGQDLLENLEELGQIEFSDGQILMVLVGKLHGEQSSRRSRRAQYEVTRQIACKENWADAGIFIFYDDVGRFRFGLVTTAYEGHKREFSSWRRYSYFIDRAEQSRTFLERVGGCDFSSIESIQDAFSVEAVTKEFYKAYAKVFSEAEKAIGACNTDLSKPDLRMYTQLLFNRLMFLRFIEKKGWLTWEGDSRDYLARLFQAGGMGGQTFFLSRLVPLFFTGLAIEGQQDLPAIGSVPFLNGGLFESSRFDKMVSDIPDNVFSGILSLPSVENPGGLFYRFNFTVEESTPLDIEVAVDPEMLGKVFEELVTGRHESGSYYTPRPVVSFMCREAIKGYLVSKAGLEYEAVATLVDKHDVSPLKETDARKIIEALDNLKAVDPACGSGAYLLGLLQEIVAIYRLLYSERLTRDSRSLYELKLRIISHNLYGVDIDPFATNIAMLRLWLSIAVDSAQPLPLPNLDFKIETGDSLLGPCRKFQKDFSAYLLEQRAKGLIAKKDEYLRAHGSRKDELYEYIRKEEDEIAGACQFHYGKDVIAWPVQFAEVFFLDTEKTEATFKGEFGFVADQSKQKAFKQTLDSKPGGFDIVLANPPYVRADAQFKHLKPDEQARQKAISDWKAYRRKLIKKKLFQTPYEKWDLYIPFLERAYGLLGPNGGMVFIIPDAYNAAKYAAKSHQFFLRNARIERVDFCSEIDLFDAGVNNTIVYFRRALPDEDFAPVRVRRWGDKKDDFNCNAELLKTGPQQTQGDALFRPGGAHDEGMPDGAIPLAHICYISVGMVINAHEGRHLGEFTTQELLSATRSSRHTKRFVLGKDVGKWFLRNVRYLEWDTHRAPSHFRRPTFLELQDATEKLLAVRTPGRTPKVTYDERSIHFDASSVAFVPWQLLKGVRNRSIAKSAKYRDQLRYKEMTPAMLREDLEKISRDFDLKYVLGVMNSACARDWLAKCRRSKLHVYPDDWKKLPIPKATLAQQRAIADLVQKCLDAQGKDCEEQEAEINSRVAKLYELAEEEIAIVEGKG